MKAYAIIPKNYHASFYYRIMVPLYAMSKLQDDFIGIADDNDASTPMERRIEEYANADLNLTYQPIADTLLEYVCSNQKRTDKRPAVIIDTDDNMFGVSPLNAAFHELGCKRPDGTPLMKGDKITIKMMDGELKTVWEDGANINVAENWYRLNTYKELLKRADLVTCSTLGVKEALLREVSNLETPICVTPNSVVPEHYDEYQDIQIKKPDGEVRILWQGSDTHFEDLFKVSAAFPRLAKRYPNAKFIFWGMPLHPAIEKEMPQEQYRHMSWVPYQEYKLRLCTIAHDINLAPLRTGHAFEECRSAIKWYESSVLPYPAATLAQRTGPYAAEIEDGRTGMLFDAIEDFEEKLGQLIEDEEKRQYLASNAKAWVLEHRHYLKTGPALYQAWTAASERANHKVELVSA